MCQCSCPWHFEHFHWSASDVLFCLQLHLHELSIFCQLKLSCTFQEDARLRFGSSETDLPRLRREVQPAWTRNSANSFTEKAQRMRNHQESYLLTNESKTTGTVYYRIAVLLASVFLIGEVGKCSVQTRPLEFLRT